MLEKWDGDVRDGRASSDRSAWVSRSEERWLVVLDLIFVGVTLTFFALSIGYVSLCDRLMK